MIFEGRLFLGCKSLKLKKNQNVTNYVICRHLSAVEAPGELFLKITGTWALLPEILFHLVCGTEVLYFGSIAGHSKVSKVGTTDFVPPLMLEMRQLGLGVVVVHRKTCSHSVGLLDKNPVLDFAVNYFPISFCILKPS